MRAVYNFIPIVLTVLAFICRVSDTQAQNWEIIDSPNPNAYENVFWSVGGSSSDNIWAVGSYNVSDIPLRKMNFTARWDGGQWNHVQAPNLSETYNILYGVVSTALDDAWAIGTYTPYGASQMTILRWNGNEWYDYGAPIIEGGAGLYAMHMVSQDDIWAVGAKLYYGVAMHWTGSDWEYMEAPPVGSRFNRFWAVDASAPDNVWAAGRWGDDYGHFRPLIMRWNGSNWQHIPGPEGYAMVINGITVISPDDVWMVGITMDAQPRFLHWNGHSVEIASSPGGGRSIAGISYDDIWSVSGNSVVHWDGSDWLQDQVPEFIAAYAVEIIPGGEMWAVGSRYDAGYGASMTMRYPLPTGVDDNIGLNPLNFELSQNYPNPFNASTSINFSLEESSNINIEVFDILGRKVGSLLAGTKEAGNHSVTWKAEDEPSGVYFYRLTAGEYNITRRMFLLK